MEWEAPKRRIISTRSALVVPGRSTLMMSVSGKSDSRASSAVKSSSAMRYPALRKRWQAAMISSSTSTAFENLDDGQGRRKQSDQVVEQHFARAVDEGAPMVAEGVDTEQQGTVERAARCDVGISVKRLFQSVSEEQFVSEHFFVAVEDGLAATKRMCSLECPPDGQASRGLPEVSTFEISAKCEANLNFVWVQGRVVEAVSERRASGCCGLELPAREGSVRFRSEGEHHALDTWWKKR